MNPLKVKALAVQDQVIEATRKLYSELQRIGASGPDGSERDDLACRFACNSLLGFYHWHLADLKEAPDATD